MMGRLKSTDWAIRMKKIISGRGGINSGRGGYICICEPSDLKDGFQFAKREVGR